MRVRDTGGTTRMLAERRIQHIRQREDGSAVQSVLKGNARERRWQLPRKRRDGAVIEVDALRAIDCDGQSRRIPRVVDGQRGVIVHFKDRHGCRRHLEEEAHLRELTKQGAKRGADLAT